MNNDYINEYYCIIGKIQELNTDIFLTDKPMSTKVNMDEGYDFFHKDQMYIYSLYSDGSLL